jgi:hypothetical protein
MSGHPHAGRGPATDAMAGVLALSSTATVPDRWMPAGRSAGQTRPGDQPTRTARSKDSEGITLLRTGLTTATTDSCSGARRPSRASAHCCPRKRLGSRVARDGDWHPLWRVRLQDRFPQAALGVGGPQHHRSNRLCRKGSSGFFRHSDHLSNPTETQTGRSGAYFTRLLQGEVISG